jgi:hypothetical protein
VDPAITIGRDKESLRIYAVSCDETTMIEQEGVVRTFVLDAFRCCSSCFYLWNARMGTSEVILNVLKMLV